MEPAASTDKRLDNIRRLGELVPQLRETVYEVDYINLLKIYKCINQNPKAAGFRFMKDYVQNLRDVASTAELYRDKEESKNLLLNAVSILEEIIGN